MARFIDQLKRTHSCGALRSEHIGQNVVLFGWVQSRRDHGGCIFIDLRDREGITQVMFDAAQGPEAYQMADAARPEWVLGIAGVVRDRGSMKNDRIATGHVEVVANEATVFNKSETPPFPIEDRIETHEDKRLEYRFLDLRRGPLQRTLRMRHTLLQATRTYLTESGFWEFETPVLVKYTPGGARNFLVPARMSHGNFYALAESPQLFKQLLMISGFDRYFQIVRCFRDEDLRIDRQPEFTQIDLEMSFVNQDDIFKAVEGLVFRLFSQVLNIDLNAQYPSGQLPRMTYEESMRRYGNDKPDLRFGLEHTDLTDLVVQHKGGGIPLLQPIAEGFISGKDRADLPSQIVKALVVPASANLSRADLEKLEKYVNSMGAKGLARARVDERGEWQQSPLAKFVTPEFRQAVNEAVGVKPGELILFQFGRTAMVHTVMANLRLHLGRMLGMIPEVGTGGNWNLLWVVDPPLFEYDTERKAWAAAHHPFTRPHDEALAYVESDPGKVLCYRYDLVLNGFEIGGGSIRLHEPHVQAQVFRVLGIGDEEAQEKFGFLLRALSYGAPPHGGIALGFDRLVMLLSEAESIRDGIAFPKTQRGSDMMTGAPSTVEPRQLAELGVQVARKLE